MKRLSIAFLVLFAGLLAGIQLNKDPGYVLININHWTIEMPLWLLILLTLLGIASLQIVIKIFQILFRSPVSFSKWRHKRLMQKAQQHTNKGLIEYNEGRWVKAKNHLISALPNAETPLINYLTAARAAQHMGDTELRDDYLQKAQQNLPEAQLAVEITQIQLFIENKQWESALERIEALRLKDPHNPMLIKLYTDVAYQQEEWENLLNFLPHIKKSKMYDTQYLTTLQHNIYKGVLLNSLKANSQDKVNNLYLSIPKPFASQRDILSIYVQYLIKNHDFHRAKDLLTQNLKTNFDPQLLTLFAEIPADERHLFFIEKLLKKHPESAEIYSCLGKICIDLQLWGKGKNYLKLANSKQPSPQNYESLGKLYEKLGEEQKATKSYQKGLQLALHTIANKNSCDRL